MTILLYKDGRLVVDDSGPIEGGAALDNLLMCISNPQAGDVLTYDGTIWTNKANPGLVADVSEPTEGQVLTYDGEKWTNANLPTPEAEPAAADGGDET